jgi:acetyl esterase/lipase
LYNNHSKLDIYYKSTKDITNPILIVIHGGGWISGSKNDIPIRTVSKFFAFHGFTVYSINYKLYPETDMLGMIHDVRDAIVFAKNSANLFHGDPDLVFLYGRSSGAQLALVTAYGTNVTFFRRYCGNYSFADLHVNGVASFYGLSRISSMGSRFLGLNNENQTFLYDLVSPLSYINTTNLVPTFIAAGTLDTLVPVINSRRLQIALSITNNSYVYLEIPWANHSFDGLLSGLSAQLSLYYLLHFFSHYTFV